MVAMNECASRRLWLLSSAALVGALAGYGRSAYAACVAGVPPMFVCSDANTDQQTIEQNDATVSTVDGFRVNTTNSLAISITGDGALSYTDENASVLKAADTALFIHSNGDVTNGNDGSVRVKTNGMLTGGNTGIDARTDGSGALTITANGDVTGTAASSKGIYARNSVKGSDVSVTTGTDSNVWGGQTGIDARNFGNGALTITANGNVTGTSNTGIHADNNGTDLSVTTGAGSVVTGGQYGIKALNNGNGALTITANDDVTGTATSSKGIYARNSKNGIDLSVTIGTDSNVWGGETGIYALNNGTALSVTTGVGSAVTGAQNGIYARNFYSGSLTITADGKVTGTNNAGILADNHGDDLTVTTGVRSAVTSGQHGIYVRNYGSGSLAISANGKVTGTNDTGIFAENSSYGDDVTVTTGIDSAVTGGDSGIKALNHGNGALDIEVKGDVTGRSKHGIYAHNYGAQTGDVRPIDISIASTGSVNSDGVGSDAFAIDSHGGPTSLTVAGTLNGGSGGAVQFDQDAAFDNRLELHTTGKINGNVLAGEGEDTLAFAGDSVGAFDLGAIDTGGGTQQYQGFELFQVDSGTWNFSGATSEDFDVTGGTVKGNATFGSLDVTGGTISPGNSIGAFTVNGPFRLGPDAIYEVDVDMDGNGDTIFVNDTVNLTGATLQVIAAPGAYDPRAVYTIIHNDGTDTVNGEFGTVTTNLAFLDPSVDYEGGDGNDVDLSLIRNDVQFPDVARTKNQKSVARTLQKFPNNGTVSDAVLYRTVLSQTAVGARQAFDALSGEIHASVAGTLAGDSRYAREAVLGRLMQVSHADEDPRATDGPQVASLYDGKSLVPRTPERAPLAFWTQGFGAWGNYDSDGNAASASRDLGGFLSGMDADIGGGWRAGLATGATFSSVSVNARASAANVATYHLGGYLGGMMGGFALRGGGLWAWNSIDTSRAVIFPGFFERQKANYDADTGQLFGEIAYPSQMGRVGLEPFFGLAYVSVDSDTFRERGGPEASLRGVDMNQDVGYTTLGLRLATTMQWGMTQVTPHFSAAWQHAFDDVTPGASLAFASNGIGFAIDGVPLAEDAALIDVGLNFALGENGTAGAAYAGQFGDGVTDNAVKASLTWLF